jgi:hypothetical protein
MKNLKGRAEMLIKWRFSEGRRARDTQVSASTAALNQAARVREVNLTRGAVRRMI